MDHNEPKIVIVVSKEGVDQVRLVAPSEGKEQEILEVYSKIQVAVNRFRKSTEKILRSRR